MKKFGTVLMAALVMPGSFMLLGMVVQGSCRRPMPPVVEDEGFPPGGCVVWERDGRPVAVSHPDWAHLVPGGMVSASSAVGRKALESPCRRIPMVGREVLEDWRRW